MMDRYASSYGCLMACLPNQLEDMIKTYALLLNPLDVSNLETNPHCTIKYGIHTDNASEVVGVIRPIGAVGGTLYGVSAFHNPDGIVLKIDVESEGLRLMNEVCTDNLACTDTWPVYQPHITIAYLKPKSDSPYYYRKYFTGVFDGIKVSFRDFCFCDARDKEYKFEV